MIAFFDYQLPQILYSLFCALAIAFSVMVIAVKNPVSSAFSLILVLLNVAGIFALQEAYFISAVQVLVYAGAIMVLFVFVIMLLSVELVEGDWAASKVFRVVPILSGFVFFALMTYVLIHGSPTANKGAYTAPAIAEHGGNIRVLSEVMFSDYVLPFQIVGLILSVAVVGAVVLAKRKVE